MPGRRRGQRWGLPAGPLLALLAWLLLPDSHPGTSGEIVAFSAAGRATAAVALWMAVWWLSEAIPISATALLPLALLPLLGATPIADAAAPYANELIFLFMGGFLIALAMERHGLHRRIAWVALRLVGDRPASMVGGFMAVSALLSMWVSNTATAIVMLPVATSLVELVRRQVCPPGGRGDPDAVAAFATCLMLGIAYAASIGGMATPIGTPPNLFAISFLRTELDVDISFVRWMGVGLPLVAVFLPTTWLLLTRWVRPIRLGRIEGAAGLAGRQLQELGPMSRAERIALAVFLGAAGLWVTRPWLVGLGLWGARPLAGLSDAGIAMLAAVVLFVAPSGRDGRRVLDWETAQRLPWGILLLFGGGLSLAASIQANGVGELLGGQVAAFAGLPPLLVVVGVVTGIVFLTELTSNTATTATLVPILASLAPGLGLDPLQLVVPATLAASCAFMLPVATPPNAIVFASGLVTIAEMRRAGFWLNWVSVVVVTALTHAVVMPLLAG